MSAYLIFGRRRCRSNLHLLLKYFSFTSSIYIILGALFVFMLVLRLDVSTTSSKDHLGRNRERSIPLASSSKLNGRRQSHNSSSTCDELYSWNFRLLNDDIHENRECFNGVFDHALRRFVNYKKVFKNKSIDDIAVSLGNISLPLRSTRFPTSFPLLTGDSMRAISDLEFNRTHLFNERYNASYTFKLIKDTKNVLVIFLKTHLLKEFIKVYLNNMLSFKKRMVQAPFILITMSSDSQPMDRRDYYTRLMLMNSQLVHWFAQNNNWIGHNKITNIPIGVMSDEWRRHTRLGASVEEYVNLIRSAPPVFDAEVYDFQRNPRPTLIYVSFNIWHPLRTEGLNVFSPLSQGSDNGRNLIQSSFLKKLTKSKFVLCPPGLGEDTFRLAESIFAGAIPVILNSTLYPLYKDMPVYIIDELFPVKTYPNRSTTENWRRNLLKFEFSDKEMALRNRKKLLFEYWYAQVVQMRDHFTNRMKQYSTR